MDATPEPRPHELAERLARMRQAWIACPPPVAQREQDLRRLRAALRDGREAMLSAIADDFGHRSRHESLLADLVATLGGIDHALRHLRRWSRPRRAAAGWRLWPARARVVPRPLGVVGIMSPWNYPVTLALAPMASALAAGNHVMLKPSELAPRTGAWLRDLVAGVFPAERAAVVRGGPAVGEAFAALPFDHLLFTGSAAVGRKVLAAAAPNLTPVTLELGGRSPAIVCPDAPLARSAARIATGKWFNAGQTCLGIDHAWIDAPRLEAFVAALQAAVRSRFGESMDGAGDYTRIIDARHFDRLRGLVEDARARGARVVELARVDPDRARDERLLPPTLVVDPPPGSTVLAQEVFGPVLPVRSYARLGDALDTIAAEAHAAAPLALYPFTGDARTLDAILARVPAGGVTVNDALWHFGAEALPFGGRGTSGFGRLHGRHGFDTFSHLQAVLSQPAASVTDLLRPPYRGLAGRVVERLAGR